MTKVIDRIPYEACPLCSCRELAKVLSVNCSLHPMYHPDLSPIIDWLRCAECAHVFTSGYFPPEALALIFSRTMQHQQVLSSYDTERVVAARIIDKVLPLASEGPWLDIGFGNAALLLTAEEYGFEPVGVDLRPQSVADLTGVGVEAYCADFTALEHDGRYSVISMADVLEHMPFPATALQSVHRLLRPEGVLFVSMPSMNSHIWKELDRRGANPYWGEIEHFHNFTRERLFYLLQETGFTHPTYGISELYPACMEVLCRRAG